MQKPVHVNRKPLYAAIVGGVFAVSATNVVIADAVNPTAQQNPLILAAAGTDKKNRRGVLRAALPRGLARMDREAGYTRPLPLRPLRAVLRRRGLAS